jgi:F-type H+-transporting ATPase subunit epsilon
VAKELHVDLVAVERKIWSGEARMLIARTTEGELGVLPGHAPLLGQLADPGTVRIQRDGQEELAYAVYGGFLSVTESGVTVLAESCEPVEPGTHLPAEAHAPAEAR